MANMYKQTLEDAKTAAAELRDMDSRRTKYENEKYSFEGWHITQLGRNDHTWDDGDWREEWDEAVVDVDGRLWIRTQHKSLQTDIDGTQRRRDDTELTKVGAGYLLAIGDAKFRKIRDAIDKLV